MNNLYYTWEEAKIKTGYSSDDHLKQFLSKNSIRSTSDAGNGKRVVRASLDRVIEKPAIEDLKAEHGPNWIKVYNAIKQNENLHLVHSQVGAFAQAPNKPESEAAQGMMKHA